MSNPNNIDSVCEVIPKAGDYDETTIAVTAAASISTTTMTHPSSTSTSASIPTATTTSTSGAFRLPDGRIMDSKNTLQSFDAVAAQTNHHPKQQELQQQQQQQKVQSTATTNVSDSIHPNDDFIICAQAVPVNDVTIIAEGELFDPRMYMQQSLPTPPTTTTPQPIAPPPTTPIRTERENLDSVVHNPVKPFSIPLGSAKSPIQSAPKTSSLAVASMVCGSIGIVFFGILLGPLAIIMGAIAMNRINKNPLELSGRGMAQGGMICGVVALVVYIAVIILIANN